jgi:hypothetical protein
VRLGQARAIERLELRQHDPELGGDADVLDGERARRQRDRQYPLP